MARRYYLNSKLSRRCVDKLSKSLRANAVQCGRNGAAGPVMPGFADQRGAKSGVQIPHGSTKQSPRESQDSRGFFLVVSGDGRGSWQASLARLAGQRCFGGAAERIRTLWRRLPIGPDHRAGASRNAAAERSGVRTGPPHPVDTRQQPASRGVLFPRLFNPSIRSSISARPGQLR